jgi:hypothetical protein
MRTGLRRFRSRWSSCRRTVALRCYLIFPLMKKTIFTLVLLAGVAGTAQAQSDVSLGLKAGASLSNFTGADAKDYKNLFGFHAGVFANIGITSMVAFQPELLYTQKGAKRPLVGISGPEGDLTLRAHYVDVPLVFHVNANGLFFEAGPQVGLLVGAQSKFGNTSTDVKDRYNTLDVGYVAGLGYQRKTGPGIGLRYNGGFTNVGKAITAGGTTFQDRARNSDFQLYVTYSFGG